jgi:hypothetical protein
MHCESYSSPSLANTLIIGNTAEFGGGLNCYNHSSPTLVNCTFSGNAAIRGDRLAGGMSCFESSRPMLENTIIAFSVEGDAVRCLSGSIATLTCCDVYGNADGDWTGCIAAQAGVNGNFSADPLFCDPSAGDFRLQSDSPCLPGNHPLGWNCGLVGALGQGCGPVALTPQTWARVKARYR